MYSTKIDLNCGIVELQEIDNHRLRFPLKQLQAILYHFQEYFTLI